MQYFPALTSAEDVLYLSEKCCLNFQPGNPFFPVSSDTVFLQSDMSEGELIEEQYFRSEIFESSCFKDDITFVEMVFNSPFLIENEESDFSCNFANIISSKHFLKISFTLRKFQK